MPQHAEARPWIVLHPAHAIVGLGLVAERRAAHRPARGLVVGRQHLVQEGEVRRVDRAFQALDPVAVLPFLGDEARGGGDEAQFELGQLRHRLARAHVDPDHVGPFARRIGQQLDRVLVRGLRRRGRQVDAVAVDVELPAVEGAAQAAILVAAVIEVGAAMRTVRLDDADPSVGLPEGQQVLAEQADLLRRSVAFGKFLREQRRHPEAPQHLAHGRALAGPGQERIVLLAEHFLPRFSCRRSGI